MNVRIPSLSATVMVISQMAATSRIDSDRSFINSARLHAIVPETSKSRFSEALANSNQGEDDADDEDDGENLSMLPVKQRRLLFFGTLVFQPNEDVVSYLSIDPQMKD